MAEQQVVCPFVVWHLNANEADKPIRELQVVITQQGELAVCVRLRGAPNAFDVIEADFAGQRAKWAEMRASFPDLKVETAGENIFVYGRADRVKAFGRLIKKTLRECP